MITKLSALREEITKANERIEFLEEQLDSEVTTTQRLTKDLQSERAMRIDAQNAVTRMSTAPFTRAGMERFTRLQLVTFIEEAINEARRKGMLEAEGLLSRHNDLSDQTDLEMMRGLVRMYSARIAELEREVAAKAQRKPKPEVKLDTRPLADKITLPPTSPSWWNVPAGGFTTLDERAKLEEKKAQLAREQQARLDRAAVATDKPMTGGKDGSRIPLDSEGGTAHVPGDGPYMYDLLHRGDVYSCTCKAWQYQPNTPANRRTCKHLRRYRGERAEELRVQQPQPSCYCGVLLVNGQCQVHTANWKGDERCNCGRSFAFCNEEYRSGRSPTRNYHTPRLHGTPEPAHQSPRPLTY